MRRVRTSLVQAAAASARRGELANLLRAADRVLRLRLDLPLPRPLFATLAVTYRCNYRCFMCDLPQRARRDPETSTLKERVTHLRTLGAVALGITGGEPLLHPGLWEVVDHARRLGFLVHLNSNGSLADAARVTELCLHDLHSVNLSVDGARAQTHDALRGVPGSFETIRKLVERLAAERSRPRIGLVMALSHRNLEEAAEFVALGERWGADACGFIPHHAFVADEAVLEDGPRDALRAALAALQSRTDHSRAYLSAIPDFLAGARMPERCSAPRSHVAVDPEGRRYPCVPLMTLQRAGVAPEDPRTCVAPSPRDTEEICRRCWWNCHRELDLSSGYLRPKALRARALAHGSVNNTERPRTPCA